MTKNRSMKIAVLVLALALLTSCFIGSTFAKYTSTGTGEATFQIASWEFSGDVNIETNEVDFSLVDTIIDTDDGDDRPSVTNVAAERIAPGTRGSGAVTVTNNSEVVAKLTFALDADDLTALNFLDFTYSVKVGANEAETKTADQLAAGIEIGMGETVIVTTNWVWEFTDTVENTLAGTAPTVGVTVVLEQVD